MQRKTRYCVKYSSKYLVVPATFHITYIAENRLPFGQCVLCSTQTVEAVFQGSNLTCITVTLKDGRVLIN